VNVKAETSKLTAQVDGESQPPTPGMMGRYREGVAATRDAVQTLGLSAALWILYVPHHVVLWSLGPRYGMAWVRLAANIHWLLTFVGAQRSARRALKSMQPYFENKLSVSQILRRHLLMKHECFARVRVYSQHATRNPAHGIRWQCHPECESALPNGERKAGLVIVGYHFNFYQTFAAGLADFFPGVKLVQLRYKTSRAVEKAASPIARLALKKAMEADRRAGATVFFLDDLEAIVQLYRMLREGGVAAVTADGGAAGDFVDVPFFDGTFRVPAGWAKLAAATRSEILLVCDKDLDRHTRSALFFDHVRCSQNNAQAAYQCVAESIQILEKMIREEPWGWHPWQRLRVEVQADGVRRYSLKQYGFDEGQRLDGKSAAPADVPAAARNGHLGIKNSPLSGESPARPRVAVVANSFPPYRVHLHEQIVEQIPEVELWSLSTHGNSYQRWNGLKPPQAIRPVDFGRGEPTNEQPQMRFAIREWRKGGRIIRWLKEHAVDAVFVQGCGDMARIRIIRWCKQQGIPCYLTGDFNIRSDSHSPLKQWLKYRVYNRAVGWSYGLMPCGKHGLDLLHRYGGQGKPALMFPFAPNVDLFENPPADAVGQMRDKFKLDPNRRRIVFSGRMMWAKRPDLAIAAFAAIAEERPDWDLVMIGDGALRDSIEASVPAHLRERVVWTGFLNGTREIAGIYAQCDAMLLPSDHEPWGVVIVEAAAAGLAIVASDRVGAAPELVKEGVNGFTFPKGDLPALTAVLRQITNPDQIEAFKLQSLVVLHQWLAECDPVAAFRAALNQAGVIAPAGEQDAAEDTYGARPEVAAAMSV
jgi:glycosyltransferase involved in cell wall biosynthesis/lauroyl/myristoyl acyltransferase